MDIKDTPAAEKPKEESPVRIGFMEGKTATILVMIDLDRMSRASARGHLLHADEVVCEWHNERNKFNAQRGPKIHFPGANAAKDAVVKLKSLLGR